MYVARVEAEHIVTYSTIVTTVTHTPVPRHHYGVVFIYRVICQEPMKCYGFLPSFSLAPPGVEHISKSRNGWRRGSGLERYRKGGDQAFGRKRFPLLWMKRSNVCSLQGSEK